MASKSAITILKEDHKNVKALFAKIKETTERGAKTRRELLDKIEHELKVHMKVEEEIFYPAFRKAVGSNEGDKMFHEAHEEHRAADNVLIDLKKTEPNSTAFSGRVKVLAELVEHHADEEEDEMFAKARKCMSNEELRQLGDKIQERKRQLENGKSRRKEVRAIANRIRA